MNEPLKSGFFEVDQMFRFVNSLCSWDGCREPVVSPAVIEVKICSLYCKDHGRLAIKNAISNWPGQYPGLVEWRNDVIAKSAVRDAGKMINGQVEP